MQCAPLPTSQFLRCAELGTGYEQMELKVGDFAFTVQDPTSGQQLVLPIALERKTPSDLRSSRQDGARPWSMLVTGAWPSCPSCGARRSL